ncbi:MAG: DUF2797 domain-containing protein [Natronospirillum sp.]
MTDDLFSEHPASTEVARGPLTKMPVAVRPDTVDYWLQVGATATHLNPLLGQPIQLSFTGRILCQHCGTVTKKSWQGFCYEHFVSLAQADNCIMSPEKCHFDLGTCREPDWGEHNCFQTHYVYLANTGQVKVGITRGTQVPTRWIDQGAEAAIPVARVRSRYLAGLIEVLLAQHISDKTNWRQMLKGKAEPQDLAVVRDRLFTECHQELTDLQSQHGIQAIQLINQAAVYTVIFPVTQYPEKLLSLNLDKIPEVNGRLLGIKGQYLILDTGVINIRRFTGYEVAFSHAH